MTNEKLTLLADNPKAFMSRADSAGKLIAARKELIEYYRGRAEDISVTLKHAVSFGNTPSRKVETYACAIQTVVLAGRLLGTARPTKRRLITALLLAVTQFPILPVQFPWVTVQQTLIMARGAS